MRALLKDQNLVRPITRQRAAAGGYSVFYVRAAYRRRHDIVDLSSSFTLIILENSYNNIW